MRGREFATAVLSLLLAGSALAALPDSPPAAVPGAAAVTKDLLLGDEELLDRLAPLGTGAGNAGDFFAALRPGGSGAPELAAAWEIER